MKILSYLNQGLKKVGDHCFDGAMTAFVYKSFHLITVAECAQSPSGNRNPLINDIPAASPKLHFRAASDPAGDDGNCV